MEIRNEEIKLYDTLSSFYEALGIPFTQEAEFTIHTTETFRQQYPSKSPLFRANYYTFVIIHEGYGHSILDSHIYDTRPNTIYFTNPGHVKGFEIIEPYQGYLITFSETFLKQYVGDNVFEEFPFLLAEIVPPHYLDATIFSVFAGLCAQLLSEYHSDSLYKYTILSNLLVVFLLKIKERFWNRYNPQVEGTQSSQIVTTFKKHLEHHFRALRTGDAQRAFQVQDFARMQNLHPNYFSTVIKSKTGKTVNTWIVEKTIAEAQALLAQTHQPIKAIAYQLGFQEPTHFSRFFKKHTGLTPGAFRRTR
ncbi:MAG: helix-turn-helix transcriptional regulator [Anaerolineaceae bacterium]|nr:helix-turn-helix transcriptional regulator [Anaerolineaceae bacterium]